MGTNIHLRFPAGISTEPVVCNLTRLFDLDFNITTAQISERREGFLILELLAVRKTAAGPWNICGAGGWKSLPWRSVSAGMRVNAWNAAYARHLSHGRAAYG